METNTFSSTIVLELLRYDNYPNWSVLMRNYLLAQDLWDIVEQEDDEIEYNKAREKNNAAALHAIQISCRVNILSEIREIRSAKLVWKKLATMCMPINSSNIPEVQYQPLITAIEDGNWDNANHFLSEHEDAKSARMSHSGDTILHVAVYLGRTEIVEGLVELMSEEELEKTNDHGYTALAMAAGLQDRPWMVESMLRSPNLFNIGDRGSRIPLLIALEKGNRKIARCLYIASLPHQTLSGIDASTVLTQFILLNEFDLALDLLDRYPRVAIVPNMYGTTPLFALATKSSAFRSGDHLMFWKNWIYDCIPIRSTLFTDEIQIEIHNPVLGLLHQLSTNVLKLSGVKQIYKMKLLHHQARPLLNQMCDQVNQRIDYYVREASIQASIQAIKGGIVEFINEIIIENRSLLYTTDTMGRNILFYSVLHRQAKIFNLLCRLSEEGSNKHSQDSSRSTILHMAAMLEPSSTRDCIPGEALKMQSELQWFKMVERICPPWIKDIQNDTNMTARELFTHNHKDMMKEGEKWTKETASVCTVVGALIITIMFTAALTVRGGNDQNTGFSMFSHKMLFTVFNISDALSLFSSLTSVLIFLGMVTTCYAEEDFFLSLPLKMIIGHYTLFFSIATMMIAFCAGLCIMLPGKSWLVIPAICLASVTVIQFTFMLFPLLVYMLKQMLTYGLGMRYFRRLF